MTTALDQAHPLVLLAAAVASVLAVARWTRLVTSDTYPPMVALRQRFRAAVSYGPWEDLVVCPWCHAPWPMLVSLLWAWFGGLDPESWSGGLWWLAHLWFALAYLASMVVVRDEPPED